MPNQDTVARTETPFEIIERELQSIEWGDDIRDPNGWCVSCARSKGGGHGFGCAIRIIREQLEAIPEIYFS